MMHKNAKIISNIAYGVGAATVLGLLCAAIFGGKFVLDPDPNAMFNWTLQDAALFGLACGALPMVLACVAAYKLNGVKNTAYKKRNFILLFLPGFVCAGLLIFLVAAFGFAYLKDFLGLW